MEIIRYIPMVMCKECKQYFSIEYIINNEKCYFCHNYHYFEGNYYIINTYP